jgi:D-amino-acid dehydrogenase
VRCDNDELCSDFVVVAAGAWSKSLALTVGDNIPLETERGYNTTVESGGFDLRTHLTFADHGFVVSKVGSCLRVGGAVELGGLKAPPNFERAKILLSKAKQFLPQMDVGAGQEWMGFRPSMPDSLPVFGSSPKQPRVIYAFGHGHLGLTQSAATAELVRDTILGKPWPIASAPFSPARFAGMLSI